MTLLLAQSPSEASVPSAPGMTRQQHAACCRGDAAALDDWVSSHQKLVFAFLSRCLGHGPQNEDLAQEVFLRGFQRLADFDPVAGVKMSTWLLGIARNVVHEARRRRGRDWFGEVSEPSTERSPIEELESARISAAFEHAAAQLPADQREAFVLAEFHDLTMHEIAVLVGVPESTAKTRVFRAREKLRTLLATIWEEP